MSSLVDSYDDYDTNPMIDFEIGDTVEFDGPDGEERIVGVIVRVYNARDDYHAANGIHRYSINRHCDKIKLIHRIPS